MINTALIVFTFSFVAGIGLTFGAIVTFTGKQVLDLLVDRICARFRKTPRPTGGQS